MGKLDIKKERHYSQKDLDHEIELINKNDYDMVIHDGIEDEKNFSDDVPIWFKKIDNIMGSLSLFNKNINDLYSTADNNNCEFVWERKNYDIIYNNNIIKSKFMFIFLITGILFLILFVSSILKSNIIFLISIVLLFTSVFIYNNIQKLSVNERDEELINKINKKYNEKNILLIIGDNHFKSNYKSKLKINVNNEYPTKSKHLFDQVEFLFRYLR